MSSAFFVSDLHGSKDRYEKLFAAVLAERPDALFLGGDLLPGPPARHGSQEAGTRDFFADFVIPGFERLRTALGPAYPSVFLILGNDDPRIEEETVLHAEQLGTWHYAHARRRSWGTHDVYGYACIPPSPFRLKDWERYDVSRFVDPGCSAPEEGVRSIPIPPDEAGRATILEDLTYLFGQADLGRAILLCHVPPYRTNLDRAALDGRMVDHVPVDVHIGSIAVRRLIEARQPLLTLHGHVHEAARITGSWSDRIGRTVSLSAAHDGPELALVRFDPEQPGSAVRELI